MMDKMIEALKSYTQADEDGIMVLVSRQACDEAVKEIEDLREQLKASNAFTGELMEDRDEWRRRAEAAGLRVGTHKTEIESLRSMVAKDSESLRNRAIEIADLVTERDEWKRRAEEMHYWLQTGTCSEHKQYDNFWEEFLYNNAEAAKWFEEE